MSEMDQRPSSAQFIGIHTGALDDKKFAKAPLGRILCSEHRPVEIRRLDLRQ